MTTRCPDRPPTKLEAERAAIKLRAKELYLEGKSTEEVGKLVGKSPSVVNRYLKQQGVTMRKRWDRGHGIREDGKKQCPKCEQWKMADNDNFYWIEKNKRLSSYCKPCDSATAVANSRRSRQAKRRAAESRKRERMRHNAQSRLILQEAANYIAATQHEDLEIVQEIKAHLAIGQKLFHDS